MKNNQRSSGFHVNDRMIAKLTRLAREAFKSAYAPYSRFRVGAAVLAGSGKIYTGSNVENASYGLTICAERVAIFSAAHNGEREICAVAIATEKDADKSPCGACLQVINELAGPNTVICIDHGRRPPVVRHLREYLPLPFKFK